MNPVQPASMPDDEHLADIVRFIAKTCLEVERGLRSPDQLTQFLDRHTNLAWRRTYPIGRFEAGPVLRREVGDPQITREGDALFHVSVTTRTDRHRWGALTFELRRDRGRWTVANLQRLLAASHYRTGDDSIQLEIPLEQRIRSATDERTLVNGALRATKKRLGELDKRDPAYTPTRQLADSWERIKTELDDELALLRTRLDLRQEIAKAKRR